MDFITIFYSSMMKKMTKHTTGKMTEDKKSMKDEIRKNVKGRDE